MTYMTIVPPGATAFLREENVWLKRVQEEGKAPCWFMWTSQGAGYQWYELLDSNSITLEDEFNTEFVEEQKQWKGV